MIRLFLCLAVAFSSLLGKERENFNRENLVPWCIVPFDASKRSPEERAKMLVRLGLKRSAYDWRAQHVSEFEEEILQYKKHGIEFFAFWNVHEKPSSSFKNIRSDPKFGKPCAPPSQALGKKRSDSPRRP